MACTSPINIEGGQQVACGRCLGCRISKTREWKMRLLQEQMYWDKALYVTLTYDDEHVPFYGLEPRDLTLFLKRLRKEVFKENGTKIKYFACGEYGPENLRPHFHAIIFGTNSHNLIREKWGKGFVKCGTVTPESIQYVTGYIRKKLGGPHAKEIYGSRILPFQRCSKGIGVRWMEENKESLVKNLGYNYKGIPLGLPRYYRRKLGELITIDSLNQRVLTRLEENNERYKKQKLGMLGVADYERALRKQREDEYKVLEDRCNKRDKLTRK